ncbi:MAG: putative Exopolysaccharide biosynthesis protein [Herbinix sp.]|nr:putative Exopolysaccharide biosynthesis protein [Herbinix sp.]
MSGKIGVLVQMKNFITKPYRYAMVFSLLLILAVIFILLDTFVIPKSYQAIVPEKQNIVDSGINKTDDEEESGTYDIDSELADETTDEKDELPQQDNANTDSVITTDSYEDSNIKIKISTIRAYESNVYIADIEVSDVSYLKTALAGDVFGRNIKDTTSEIAEEHQAIFAVNGDFYGFRDYGYVLRNGVLYRDVAGDAEALLIDKDGDFSIMEESDIDLSTIEYSSLWQIMSFGPALINAGEVVVDSNSEVARSMSSNPRTAIGEISPLHYIIVVSDGRTDESAGLSLLELAQVFLDQGCVTAYNLDGGGSSTMYFNGEIVNVPTDGRTLKEREVSDIVYIGY